MAVDVDPAADGTPCTSETADLQSLAERRAEEIVRSLSRGFLRGPFDSERRKILAKVYMAIRWAQEIDARGGLRPPECSMVVQLLASDATKLGLDALLALMDTWDRTLIETGDDKYVRTLLRAELVRDRQAKTTVMTWSDVFSEDDRTRWEGLLAEDPKPPIELEQAETQLLQLYRTRINQYDLERARDVMSVQLLWQASIAVAILVAGLVFILTRADPLYTSAAAGALGGAISGARQVRDAPRRIGALRGLRPLAVLQPLVGASAGLFAYLLINAGANNILNPTLITEANRWAVFGIAAFALGFSEPVFIRVIERLTDALLKEEKKADSKPSGDASTQGTR